MDADQNPLSRLNRLNSGTTSAQALELFDSLPPVTVEELAGSWHGAEVPTGHPFDGLLSALGWYGKRFDGPDGAHPLVFTRGNGRFYEVDPRLAPLNTAFRLGPLLRKPPAARLLRPLLSLARTTQPKARLRLMEYRGKVSATMVYDAQPINDAFRRVNHNTLLGAMDMRGPYPPFIFSLRRSN